jgi:hypothetical protein
MFQCSKLPCLGWRSADFLQVFFRPKCLQEQLKHVRSSTKISMLLSAQPPFVFCSQDWLTDVAERESRGFECQRTGVLLIDRFLR